MNNAGLLLSSQGDSGYCWPRGLPL